MKQQLEFTSHDLEKLAENAEALFSWLDNESALAEEPDLTIGQRVKDWRVKIPSRLLLVTATIAASGLPVWLDQQIPNSACWFGSCSNV